MTFIKDDAGKAASLVANIQKLTDANKAKDLRSFVVFVGGPEMKATLEKIAADKKITIPLSFLPGGAGQADINRYKISPEAKNTVMVYNRQKIHATLVDVDEKTFADVEKATAEMLGP
jgi:hypothetical protein